MSNPAADAILVGFVGAERVVEGPLSAVVRALKPLADAPNAGRIAVYDDRTARPVEVDLRGGLEEVVARVASPPVSVPKRGRPKLGVVSREISLLPQHWAWLATQRGGASATLRRLVHEARKADGANAAMRQAVDAAYAFLSDIDGNLPDFEEASRALFGHDFAAVEDFAQAWPDGIRTQLRRFLDRAQIAREESPGELK